MNKNPILKLVSYLIILALAFELSRIAFDLMNSTDTLIFYCGFFTLLIDIGAVLFISIAMYDKKIK